MANEEHVAILLRKGPDVWNVWRKTNFSVRPDLREARLGGAWALSSANLTGADLVGARLYRGQLLGANLVRAQLTEANLNEANLYRAQLLGANLVKARLTEANLNEANLYRAQLIGANLYRAQLIGADLSGADLSGVNLSGAHLTKAYLGGANLTGANLTMANLNEAQLIGADLIRANLVGAKLRDANLTLCNLVEVDLSGADLTGCRIYGVCAWSLKLQGTMQQDLVITREDEAKITVDNLEVAQFIYLLLHNERIRDVVETIGKKAVLILGRFTPRCKAVLDNLREELRKRDYLPILFDFDKPTDRDITETVSLLARMARFVLADITDARSIPQELSVIVPDLPSVPVQPLLLEGSDQFGMFEHFTRYPWVLETYHYPSPERLIADLDERVIRPAEAKVLELRRARSN